MYYESANGITITQQRAVQEVERHNIEVQEFFDEVGQQDYYDAQAVLAWLGY